MVFSGRSNVRAPLGSRHPTHSPPCVQLACGGERQAKVLAAASAQSQPGGGRSGGGAMLLSISGSSHNTFADGVQTGASTAVAACLQRAQLLAVAFGLFIASRAPFALIDPPPDPGPPPMRLDGLLVVPVPLQPCRCLARRRGGCWSVWGCLRGWILCWASCCPRWPR